MGAALSFFHERGLAVQAEGQRLVVSLHRN